MPRLHRKGLRRRSVASDPLQTALGSLRNSERVLRFFRTFLRHSHGEYRGRPFDPLPFQRDIIRGIFDPMTPAGLRQVRECLLMLPRKCGKTTLAAGIGLDRLYDGEEGGQVVVAANSRDQASLLFNAAADSVDQHPVLSSRSIVSRSLKRITDKVIHSQPNEFMSSFTFFQSAIMHILLHGNHYSVIERDAAGNPVNLWPLRPESVTVEVADGTVKYRYYFGGQRNTYDIGDILHFKGPSLDGIVGMSIVGMARQGIGLAIAQDAHAGSLMRNNARLGTVITVPGTLRTDQIANMRDDFAKKFAGAMNAGKAVVMYDGMSVQTVGMSSQDAQFIESRQFSVVEIARWFRVPPTLIGDMTRVSYSSSESEMQLFCTQSIAPLCASIEAELNFKLLPSRTQFLARFDINKLVRGDQQSRYTAYSQGLNAGFLTVADVRLAEDLPFIEGTDKLNRPANLVPHDGGNNGTAEPVAGDKVAA